MTKKLETLHSKTPLEPCLFLAKQLNVSSVHFKLDNLQKSSSFKLRGIGNCIKKAKESQPNLDTIVSSSGGNAGKAAAIAAEYYGLNCVVFVPETTSSQTQEILRSLNAKVVVHGSVWDETNIEALKYLQSLKQGHGFYVHPFEHPDTWQGHSTLVKEIEIEIGLPDVIICSVGGGGLLCGILTGLLAYNQRKTIVIAVETEGAASFAAAVNADEPVTLDGITSIAKSLGAKKVCSETLRLREIYGKDLVRSLVISDRQALLGVTKFADDYRYLVEPACGAAIIPVYDQDLLRSVVPELSRSASVVVEVCGGFQVSLELIDFWKTKV